MGQIRFLGPGPPDLHPRPYCARGAIRAQFAAELQQQTPIQPWSALSTSTGTPWLERFDGDACLKISVPTG